MRISKCWTFAAAFAASMALVGAVQAASITSQSFDSNPILSDTQGAGVWYTDRFAPSGFESEFFLGDNRLAHTISSADGASGRPSGFASAFYNTQGRKFDTAGATEISIDFFVDSAFQSDPARIAGIWGTGFLGDGTTISAFPILEFAGGTFQVFDTIGGDSDGTGFRTLDTAPTFNFDEFVELGIVLDTVNDVFNYFIGGLHVHTEEAGGTQTIGNVILQNINTDTGVNRTVYWDNLQASSVSAVPVPAAFPLLAGALAGFGLISWRKRRVSA